jgi:hypothetical protein
MVGVGVEGRRHLELGPPTSDWSHVKVGHVTQNSRHKKFFKHPKKFRGWRLFFR